MPAFVPHPVRSLGRGWSCATVATLGALIFPGMASAGSISVSSDVPGQEILVDGQQTGRFTPGRVDDVAPGRHTVRVQGACQIGETTVNVLEQGVVDAAMITRPAQGEIKLRVEPAEASVTVDGLAMSGQSTLSLSCGSHSVRVTHPGYLQELIKVDVGAGETLDLAVQMEALGVGSLVVRVVPKNAEVSLDGTFVTAGDYTNSALTAGPHVVEVKAAGFLPKTEMFSMERDSAQSFDIALDRDPAGAAIAKAPKDPKPPKAPRDGGGEHTLRNVGIGLAVVGGGVGIFGLTRFAVSGQAYQDYLAASEDPNGTAGQAQAIRDQEVVPARNLGVTLSTVGGALLAGGLTMAIAF